MTMKKQYIQPQMRVDEMELAGNLMIGSTVEVSSEEFNPDDYDALGRESVWGKEEGESKFWF